MKRTVRIATGIVGTIIALPFMICLLAGLFSSNKPPPQEPPPRWDMDKLKQDVNRAVKNPNDGIFIPNDGSQPVVVPNAFP